MPALEASRRLVTQAAAVCAAGAVLGLLANPWTPRPVTLGRPVFASSTSGTASCSAPTTATTTPARISQPEARTACNACTAAFVDARGENAFALGHISGALHLPPAGQLDEPSFLSHLKGFQTVVVYDDDVGCKLAEGVAKRLMASGLANVRVLDGNWTQWASSGGPAQSGACEECSKRPASNGSRP